MAKYKVKVISHLCKNNYMAKYGEIVDENQLTSSADGLVNAGFIELFEDVNEKSFNLDSMSKKDLIEFAKSNNFNVTETANKQAILIEIDNQLKAMEVVGDVKVEK